MAWSSGNCNDPIFVNIKKIIQIHLASSASAIHLWVSLVSQSSLICSDLKSLICSPQVKSFSDATAKPLHVETKQNECRLKPWPLIHMAGFGKDCSKALVNFRLEWLERNTLSIYADVTVTGTFRDDAVTEDLAVPDVGHVKKLAIFESEHHVESGCARDVAVDAYKIHVAIIRKRSLKEHSVCGHICHLDG